jgi:hypothetical protein
MDAILSTMMGRRVPRKQVSWPAAELPACSLSSLKPKSRCLMSGGTGELAPPGYGRI